MYPLLLPLALSLAALRRPRLSLLATAARHLLESLQFNLQLTVLLVVFIFSRLPVKFRALLHFHLLSEYLMVQIVLEAAVHCRVGAVVLCPDDLLDCAGTLCVLLDGLVALSV